MATKRQYYCGLDAALSAVGGRWKYLVVWQLAAEGPQPGLTTAASTHTAATSHQSTSGLLITLNAGDQPLAEIPYQKVSGHLEAVHAVMCKG